MAGTSEPFSLGAGELGLDLVPAIGGSVASFRLGDIELMRPLSAADRVAGNVLGVAMFPMTPYANRIAGNRFDFRGKSYTVAANNPPERFNVHGTGWHRPWRVTEQSATEARLELEVIEAGAAYAYRASQHFVLTPEALSVTLTIANAGAEVMPFGFGLHPWFERDADVTLQFSARRFYLEEPEGVSGNPVTLPPELDFASARPLPRGWRNNDHGGWDGVATLRFPGRGVGLTLRADPVFKHLMLYADPTRPYFCVEPQSNAAGAFNRPGGLDDPEQGVIVLEPGASAEGTVRFEPFRI